MADALWVTCLVLFTGALITGLPPVLWWGASPAGRGAPATGLAALLQGPSLRMLSAGLMLGSGLGVVLPEGFVAFCEGAAGQVPGLPECSAGAALLAGFVGMLALQLWLQEGGAHHHPHQPREAPHGPAAVAAAAGCSGADVTGSVEGGGGSGDYSRDDTAWRRRREGGYIAVPSSAAVGAEAVATVTPVAAAAGVELSRRHGGLSTAAAAMAPTQPHCCTADTEARVTATAPPGFDSPGGASCGSPASHAAVGICADSGAGAAPSAAGASEGGGGGVSSAQLALGGLLVHSAADGLAMGAASLGGGGGPSALSLAVAAAIMMHKLPVTLGLTTFLREAGWRRLHVLQALLAFSASAPVAALLAFYLLSYLLLLPTSAGSTPVTTDSDSGGFAQQAVALVVLFSGGTFLAAATQHILPAALAAVAPPPGTGDSGSVAVESGWKDCGEGPPKYGVGVGERGSGGCKSSAAAAGRLPLLWLAVGSLLPLLIAALLPEAD